MRAKNWKMGKPKRHVPIGEGFTGKDKEDSLKEFFTVPGNKTLWDRLEETKQHLPWMRSLVDSLMAYVEKTGTLSDPQKSLATGIYIDACVTGDDKVFEQVATRKLGYRLKDLDLGFRANHLVADIMSRSDSRPFSLGQIRVFNNIAKKQVANLTKIPKLTDETFDGWFKIAEDKA